MVAVAAVEGTIGTADVGDAIGHQNDESLALFSFVFGDNLFFVVVDGQFHSGVRGGASKCLGAVEGVDGFLAAVAVTE